MKETIVILEPGKSIMVGPVAKGEVITVRPRAKEGQQINLIGDHAITLPAVAPRETR